MVRFEGRGLLEPYSCEKQITEPVPVKEMIFLLDLPKRYRGDLVLVRSGKKLKPGDYIVNGDVLIMFLAPLGG